MVALLAVALALDFVVFTFIAGRNSYYGFSAFDYAAANPGQVVFCTLAVMGVLGIASLYKSVELRGGGGVVARSLGGVLVTADTTDLKRKRLLNVIEEMAIASGVPMPEVYVLDQEPGINAFAAGHTPANAAVTVTQGALDRLSRDELQGVIGHEFSHILNGDMRLNIQLMGWVFGLFVIGLIGRLILQFSPRSSDRRDSNAAFLALGFAIMVLGYVGLLAGRILQAAVSRQRERLADASGVQFTRNPQGLKGALVKIAALPDGSALVAADAEQAAHMFFAEGLSRVFATHPPILERIRELDPHFDMRELERAAAEPDQQPTLAEVAGHDGTGAAGGRAGVGSTAGGGLAGGILAGAVLAGGAGARVPSSSTRSRFTGGGLGGVGQISRGGVGVGVEQAARAVAQVGQPETAHIEHAQAVRLALPPGARELTESPGGAQALVLALLISDDPALRQRQLEILSKSANAASVEVVQRVTPIAHALNPMLRLPILQRAFPALRRSTVPQRKALAKLVNDLIHADARVEVFEFCLAKLLETLLNDELSASIPHGKLTLEDEAGEISLLFATLAQIGAQDEQAARAAYEVGISTVLPMRRPPFAAAPDWQQKLSAAFPRLEQLHPFAKKAVIEGLVKTVANDEMLMDEEAELLRTVCAVLHCPLPPILPLIAGDASAADQESSSS
jgi:Zn-dependent protease with chaperone function